MGGTGIALLSQFTVTHRLQRTNLPNPGLEEPQGYLTIYLKKNGIS